MVENEGNGWKELKYKKEFDRLLRCIYSSWGRQGGVGAGLGGGRMKNVPSFYFLKISNLDAILTLSHKISVSWKPVLAILLATGCQVY